MYRIAVSNGARTATPPALIEATVTFVMATVFEASAVVYVAPGGTPVRAFVKMLEPLKMGSFAPVPKS
jgi:hypothetical protein